MSSALASRKLANFMKDLNFLQDYSPNRQPYTHIGALYTNIILQAGLNYKTVVEPRVSKLFVKYPEAYNVVGFIKLIDSEGLDVVINWSHPQKIARIYELLNFSKQHSIDTCCDLANFLNHEVNHETFLQIKGIGNKTLDYTLKLLNFDTIAVDRHIYSFIELAGIKATNYSSAKKVVGYAADLLNVSRASVDYSIWNYMSGRMYTKKDDTQLTFGF